MTYVILPKGTKVFAAPWEGAQSVTLPVTVVWNVPYEHPRDPDFFKVFSLAFLRDNGIFELPPAFKVTLHYDPFVKGKIGDFAQGATVETAWASFHARK